MIYNLTIDDGLMVMGTICTFLSVVYIVSEVYQYKTREWGEN